MSATGVFVGNRILLSRLYAATLLATLLVSLNGWQTAAPFVENLLSLTGWLLIAIGVVGRIWSGSYICGFKNSGLVTDGPYSLCRNPLYFFTFVAGLGIMLTTETLLLPALFAGLFWAHYPRVIRHEEEALLRRHGRAFETYCARVPRFWPSFASYSEPATYVVSAAHFRKHLGDALWFVIAGGIVEFIEGMHISGYLPTIVRIF